MAGLELTEHALFQVHNHYVAQQDQAFRSGKRVAD
jgi:hypothetical protein